MYIVFRDENLTFTVFSRSAEYSNGSYTIYASIQLPGNKTSQKIAWQAGTEFSGGVPSSHKQTPPNILASTSIDLLSGSSVPVLTPASDNRLRRKNVSCISIKIIMFSFLWLDCYSAWLLVVNKLEHLGNSFFWIRACMANIANEKYDLKWWDSGSVWV